MNPNIGGIFPDLLTILYFVTAVWAGILWWQCLSGSVLDKFYLCIFIMAFNKIRII